MPLGGIAFDDQISSFDVTQAAQLAEKCAPSAPSTSFGQEGRRNCRMKNRYPVLRCRLLRARAERHHRRTANYFNELAPPHCRPHPPRIRTSHFIGSEWEIGSGYQCPLWVKSRHLRRKKRCPLYPQ
jgi:hypothetical protein